MLAIKSGFPAHLASTDRHKPGVRLPGAEDNSSLVGVARQLAIEVMVHNRSCDFHSRLSVYLAPSDTPKSGVDYLNLKVKVV